MKLNLWPQRDHTPRILSEKQALSKGRYDDVAQYLPVLTPFVAQKKEKPVQAATNGIRKRCIFTRIATIKGRPGHLNCQSRFQEAPSRRPYTYLFIG